MGFIAMATGTTTTEFINYEATPPRPPGFMVDRDDGFLASSLVSKQA
jgi:hypothetical protein